MNLQLKKHLKSQNTTGVMFQPKMLTFTAKTSATFWCFYRFFEWKTFFPKVDMDTKDNPSIKSAFAWIHFWKKKKWSTEKLPAYGYVKKQISAFFLRFLNKSR